MQLRGGKGPRIILARLLFPELLTVVRYRNVLHVEAIGRRLCF